MATNDNDTTTSNTDTETNEGTVISPAGESSDQNDDVNSSVTTIDKVEAKTYEELQKKFREVSAENKKYRQKAKASSEAAEEAKKLADEAVKNTTQLKQEADSRLIRAELKLIAAQEGLIDQDAFKMVDLSSIKVESNGDVIGADKLIADLKKSKPYLFKSNSTSSTHEAPDSSSNVEKEDAMSLSDEEYKKKYPASWRRGT